MKRIGKGVLLGLAIMISLTTCTIRSEALSAPHDGMEEYPDLGDWGLKLKPYRTDGAGPRDRQDIAGPTEVRGIKFEAGEGGVERVLISLDRPVPPKIFRLEGEKPRVVVDVKDVEFWNGPNVTIIEGRYVLRVRTHLHTDSHRLRVVMDLQDDKDYVINPIFYKSQGTFVVEIGEAAY